MAERSKCSVGGCDQLVHGHGLCTKHYHRWRRNGEPGEAQSRRHPLGQACRVDGCERPPMAHQMCSMHYQRWCKQGDPGDSAPLRKHGGCRPGEHQCRRCERWFPLDAFGGANWICLQCRSEQRGYVRTGRICERCGDPIPVSRRADAVLCSDTCKWATRDIRPHYQAIGERDGWTCGICGRLVDKTLRAPHPQSPTVDHILPRSLGGTHEDANLQLAHWGCNSAKANRVGDLQMRLLSAT